jgi:hypothetical protein
MHSIIETVSRMKDHNYSYQGPKLPGVPSLPPTISSPHP